MTDARDVMVAALKSFTRLDQTLPEMMVAEQMLALREAGFAVVPVEPTEGMLDAGVEASDKQRVGPIYRAMLKAAQGGTE